MNKQMAIEWLNKAWHHLSSAEILYRANHYTDVISIDLHYSVEITLKAILAYQNRKIIKTHDLIKLHSYIQDDISFSLDELDLLDKISTYHISSSYPPKDRELPSKDEIREVLEFAQNLLDRVCEILDINRIEIQR